MNNFKSGKTIWFAIFALACFLIMAFSLQGNAVKAELKEGTSIALPQEKKLIPVKMTPVTKKQFLKTINVYGKVETRQSAFVCSKVGGIIEKMYVDEGDYVEKGKTILFQVDNLKLKQKVSNAKQNLSIVLAVEKERKALLKKAQIDLTKKTRSFGRYESLFKKKAISQEVFDSHEAECMIASAELDHKKALLELGQAEARQAIINLQMMEKDFSDSITLAPIDGFISEKLLEIGEMGQVGKPVFKIDNTSELDICAYLPAEFSSKIRKNETEAEVSLYDEILERKFKVNYISPVVDPKLHIFEIKCKVEGNIPALKPGQSVQLRLFTNQHSSIAVPTASLVERNDGWAVYTVENEIAKKVAINKGSEYEGWTEIKDSALKPGDKVVSEGQFLIHENTSVKVIN